MARAPDPLTQYLDPAVVQKVDRLELRARRVVEGFIAGRHQSPYRGFSVEFAEHREYVPGDDLRHLDWKLLAKTDRSYIKQYEEQTNLRATLAVDCSESMLFAGGGPAKAEYAATLAACLGHLVIEQSDAVGLVAFSTRVRETVRARSSRPHLRAVLAALLRCQPAAPQQRRVKRRRIADGRGGFVHECLPEKIARLGGAAGGAGEPAPSALPAEIERSLTDLNLALRESAEQLPRRGLVAVISDLFDHPAEVLQGLRWLTTRGHDVMVFHVLDPWELDFPFDRLHLFDGLEQWPELLVDPRGVRAAYLEELHRFLADLESQCLAARIEYCRMRTDEPMGVALAKYLARRMRRRR